MSCLEENPNLEAFRSARARAEIAEAEQLRGHSEPYLAFWSRRSDIMIFGGLGGHGDGDGEGSADDSRAAGGVVSRWE